MDFSTLNDELAAVAHRAWCKRMVEQGWRPGERIDEDARTHDALRPYGELSAFDREQIRRRVVWDEFEQRLADAIVDALMNRELSAGDIYVGMPVRMLDDPAQDVGHIVSWDPAEAPSGVMTTINVKWPDGEVVGYCPTLHELVPVQGE